MKLSNCIEIISGGTPSTSKSDFWDGDIPWISIKDFNNSFKYIYKTEKSITKQGLEKSSTNMLYKNDIIISARGTVGCLAQIYYPMAFNQSCYGIRTINKDLMQNYLYYWLIANIDKFKKQTHGAVFDTITKNTFNNIEINYPSLVMQQHIVDIIGSLDDKIESNNKLLEKCYIFLNLNMKKLLIGKDKKIISSFDDIEIISSGIDKFKSSKIYLDTSCVSDNSIVDISNKVTYTDRPSRANMKPIKNSVWFAKLKSSPKHIIVKDYSDEILDNCIFSTGFLGIKIDNVKFNLLSTYFTSDVFEKEKDSLSIGATMQSINNVTFKGMYIPDFSPTDYIIFNNLSEPILKLIYETELENIKLQQLKLNYLTKFF